MFGAYNNATQTIATGTNTECVYNIENFDSDGKFASNRFTPTVAGKYLCHASAIIPNLDEGEKVSLEFKLNGGQITGPYHQQETVSGSANESTNVQVTQIITLDADDYVSVFIYHNEGADQNTPASINKFFAYRLTGVTS